MAQHCNGFYEIEFSRLFRMQGRVLYRLRYAKKQVKSYTDLLNEWQNPEPWVNERLQMAQAKVDKYTARHDMLESAKDEISLNNRANTERAKTERIINAAYAQAYANQI